MTDKEIMNALECCNKDDCDNCHNDFGNCYANLAGYAIDIIKRQQAENERLKINLKAVLYERADHTEAIKEFAERLKDKASTVGVDELYDGQPMYVSVESIDNLVKEIVGEYNA